MRSRALFLGALLVLGAVFVLSPVLLSDAICINLRFTIYFLRNLVVLDFFIPCFRRIEMAQISSNAITSSKMLH